MEERGEEARKTKRGEDDQKEQIKERRDRQGAQQMEELNQIPKHQEGQIQMDEAEPEEMEANGNDDRNKKKILQRKSEEMEEHKKEKKNVNERARVFVSDQSSQQGSCVLLNRQLSGHYTVEDQSCSLLLPSGGTSTHTHAHTLMQAQRHTCKFASYFFL